MAVLFTEKEIKIQLVNELACSVYALLHRNIATFYLVVGQFGWLAWMTERKMITGIQVRWIISHVLGVQRSAENKTSLQILVPELAFSTSAEQETHLKVTLNSIRTFLEQDIPE